MLLNEEKKKSRFISRGLVNACGSFREVDFHGVVLGLG
jgi:hypothetical protein